MKKRVFFLSVPLLFWLGCSGGSGKEPTAESFSQDFVGSYTDGSKLRNLLPTDAIIDEMIKCPGDNPLKKSIEEVKGKISKLKTPEGATIGYKASSVKESTSHKKGDKIGECEVLTGFSMMKLEVGVEKRLGDKSQEEKMEVEATTLNSKWYLINFK